MKAAIIIVYLIYISEIIASQTCNPYGPWDLHHTQHHLAEGQSDQDLNFRLGIQIKVQLFTTDQKWILSFFIFLNNILIEPTKTGHNFRK